jgi:hypothetical protein
MQLRRLAIRVLACLSTAAAAAPLLAAIAEGEAREPAVTGIYRGSSIAVRFDVSPPLRSIRPVPFKGPVERKPEELRTGHEGPPGPQIADPLVQTEVGTGGIPPPIATFDGPSNLAGVAPPDPVGDVGPNHYVAMSNLFFAVYDKTGGVLLGPVANNTLWDDFGGPCESENAGDPIILYDQQADRWILTQFTANGPTFFNCVAVSTTGDPTGTFYRYAFSTGVNFPDYPKYGIWTDALYISTREFLGTAGPFQGVGAYAINRAQILAGNPAAQIISFLVPPGATPYNIGDGLLPADIDGSAPPPAGSPEYFMGSMDQGGPYGAPQDALTLWKFDADFATPANSTFTLAPPIPVAAFDSVFPCTPSSRDCIPQPGTAAKVDILSYRQRLMHRLAYRNFGTHEALVSNQSVEATAGIAGIRWYEIRDPNGTPTIFQQGTYAPGSTDGIHRWMGSVAMDAVGDLALGYSASDGVSTFPSVWYTGRLASDPPGMLPQGEGSIVHGTGSQTGTPRWGDYSSLNVDPADDCTFWYVSQYLPSTSLAGWRLRVGSFRFPSCAAGPAGTLEGNVTVCGGGTPLAGASVSAGIYGSITDINGDYAFALPPGDYTVDFSATGYASQSLPATITDGGTTVLDACLVGVPLLEAADATLVAESCEPGNGRIDPGETVTIQFCVRNIGGADTADLVGDLEESGGVGDAPFPAAFGVVVAGGPDVCVDVTLTADENLLCGFDVTPTLELEDGPADLGTLAFGPFPTGAPLLTGSENFDGVTAPNLPAGWATSGSGTLWVTTASGASSPPNAAFTDDPAVVSDKRLDSPAFSIASPSGLLEFRHTYDLETSTDPATGFDGGVFEISVGGGPFEDILAAGGSFVSGGYNQTISTQWGSPIAGRPAWSGNSGGYVTTIVALPASAAGQNVVLRWRMASDTTVADVGWWIDDLQVFGASTCCTPIPEGLAVDHVEDAPSNDVWEPGETVIVEPSYFNGDSATLVSLVGTASNLTGPPGATYTIVDGLAAYGSIASNSTASCLDTGDCFAVSVDDPVVRPAPHWDATMLETLSPTGSPKTWTLHIGDSFADVPDSHIFYAFIETIFHKGITGGCGGTSYCPGNPALRKQMSVFLLKARYGQAYVPPAAVGIFDDVPQGDLFAPWIEDLYNRGITGGCSMSPLNFCPEDTVLRQQMAVFLLKTLEGAAYTPPDCEGLFGDVDCPDNPFADWIEELADREITGGCGGGNFCPTDPNTRGQMAVFLTKTFGLVLYGP